MEKIDFLKVLFDILTGLKAGDSKGG